MRRKFITTVEQLGFIAICAGLLLWLGSVYQVGAAPPEQSPSGTPEPQPGETLVVKEVAKELPLSPTTPPGAPLQQDNSSVTGDDIINLLAVDGHWTGTTSRSQPMSFDVLSSGTRWDNFKLKAPLSGCSLYNAVEFTLFGPGPITNNQFSGSNSAGTFSFSGHFNSATAASGTYAFVNFPIPGCSNFTQSGTWTASSPMSSQIPNPPTNLTALALSQMQILLQWTDNSNNETGFKIEQSLTGTGGWAQIATTPANVTSHAPPGLICGTTYYYRVRAYNGFGNSLYSNVDDATTTSCSNTGDFKIYLPLIMKNFAPPLPPPPGSPPVGGSWIGTTSRSQPMSFNVSSGGTTWNTFKLKTNFQVGPCSGTTEITVSGPGAITNNQFSGSSGSFTFSGQFNSPTTASGTYAYLNHSIPGCGNLTQSGTWTANKP